MPSRPTMWLTPEKQSAPGSFLSAVDKTLRRSEPTGYSGMTSRRSSTATQAPPVPPCEGRHMSTSPQVQPNTTTAFFVQAVISFAVSSFAVAIGVIYLPVNVWVRAFLALGMLYVITSTFALAKCVRDKQESDA